MMKRKRKFLLLLPLVLLPLLALLFYALGGGRPHKAVTGPQKLNATVPGAAFDQHQGLGDKLSAYEQQKRDSIKARSERNSSFLDAMGFDTAARTTVRPETNVAQINQRLAQLNRSLNQPQPVSAPAVTESTDVQTRQLRQMMNALKKGNAEDPEMKQLGSMMDKLIELQHPDMVAAKFKQREDTLHRRDTAFRAVPAMIDGNQKVAPGGVVKLRLADTLHIGQLLVPKGQLLFGACTVTNQRLLLDIRNIRLGTAIIPVNLTVFSLDGLAGVDAPEAELGEAAGNGTANALSGMQFLSMDQSLGTQAASAGISAATGLLAKKVRKIRVKLHGGVTVLLRVNRS